MKEGTAIFTTSKNTAIVFFAKSVMKWVCFCLFKYDVYNWQYYILHWQNYTYYTVITTIHCHFQIYEMCFASGKNVMYPMKEMVGVIKRSHLQTRRLYSGVKSPQTLEHLES